MLPDVWASIVSASSGKVNVIAFPVLNPTEFIFKLVFANKEPIKLVSFVNVFKPLIFCVKLFVLSTKLLSTYVLFTIDVVFNGVSAVHPVN